ncbi:NEDD4-like E3 ubiquitin-protein ligase WWP2 [Halotydeus destructor]|nr:NEDD4-like E3 ubiquitin-protein ligase WWP2 [Halotydeus destructor]
MSDSNGRDSSDSSPSRSRDRNRSVNRTRTAGTPATNPPPVNPESSDSDSATAAQSRIRSRRRRQQRRSGGASAARGAAGRANVSPASRSPRSRSNSRQRSHSRSRSPVSRSRSRSRTVEPSALASPGTSRNTGGQAWNTPAGQGPPRLSPIRPVRPTASAAAGSSTNPTFDVMPQLNFDETGSPGSFQSWAGRHQPRASSPQAAAGSSTQPRFNVMPERLNFDETASPIRSPHQPDDPYSPNHSLSSGPVWSPSQHPILQGLLSNPPTPRNRTFSGMSAISSAHSVPDSSASSPHDPVLDALQANPAWASSRNLTGSGAVGSAHSGAGESDHLTDDNEPPQPLQPQPPQSPPRPPSDTEHDTDSDFPIEEMHIRGHRLSERAKSAQDYAARVAAYQEARAARRRSQAPGNPRFSGSGSDGSAGSPGGAGHRGRAGRRNSRERPRGSPRGSPGGQGHGGGGGGFPGSPGGPGGPGHGGGGFPGGPGGPDHGEGGGGFPGGPGGPGQDGGGPRHGRFTFPPGGPPEYNDNPVEYEQPDNMSADSDSDDIDVDLGMMACFLDESRQIEEIPLNVELDEIQAYLIPPPERLNMIVTEMPRGWTQMTLDGQLVYLDHLARSVNISPPGALNEFAVESYDAQNDISLYTYRRTGSAGKVYEVKNTPVRFGVLDKWWRMMKCIEPLPCDWIQVVTYGDSPDLDARVFMNIICNVAINYDPRYLISMGREATELQQTTPPAMGAMPRTDFKWRCGLKNILLSSCAREYRIPSEWGYSSHESYPITIFYSQTDVFQTSYEAVMTGNNSEGWSLQKPICVRPYGSPGVDLGGLFKEWVTSLSEEFADLRAPVEMFQFDKLGYCIHPEAVHNVRLKPYFKFYGRFIGLCFFHGQLPSFTLSWRLMKLIQGDSLSLEDMKEDSNFLDMVRNVNQAAVSGNLTPEELCDMMSLSPFTTDAKDEKSLILSKTFGMRQVTLETLNEYWVHKANQMVGGAPWIISAIREGISEVVPLAFMQMFSPKELALVVFGSNNIKFEDMACAIVFEADILQRKRSKNTAQYLLKYMKSLDQERMTKFYEWWTASKSLPSGGLLSAVNVTTSEPGISVKITREGSSGAGSYFPKAGTCAQYLSLHEYKNYEQLKAHFDYILSLPPEMTDA